MIKRLAGAAGVVRERVGQALSVRKKYGLGAGIRALTSNPRQLILAVVDELQGAESFLLFAMDEAPRLDRSREASQGHRFVYADAAEVSRACEKLPAYVLNSVPYLEVGDRCLLQIEQDEPVGCTWATPTRTAYMTQGAYWNLPEHSFYSYLGETLPRWRGFGFQPLRKQMLLDEFREIEGRSWLVGYVRARAMPALRGTTRSGDRLVGRFRVRRGRGRIRMSMEVERSFWSTVPRW